MDSFDQNILAIIEKLAYPFFLVRQNLSIKCTCTKAGTGQPLSGCPRCLGTGFKIKIVEIRGASQESTMPTTMREGSGFVIAKSYYVSHDYPIAKDNIIVDGDQCYFVYQKNDLTSFHGNKVYQKCLGMAKKTDVEQFMSAFNKIVKR